MRFLFWILLGGILLMPLEAQDIAGLINKVNKKYYSYPKKSFGNANCKIVLPLLKEMEANASKNPSITQAMLKALRSVQMQASFDLRKNSRITYPPLSPSGDKSFDEELKNSLTQVTTDLNFFFSIWLNWICQPVFEKTASEYSMLVQKEKILLTPKINDSNTSFILDANGTVLEIDFLLNTDRVRFLPRFTEKNGAVLLNAFQIIYSDTLIVIQCVIEYTMIQSVFVPVYVKQDTIMNQQQSTLEARFENFQLY